MRSVVTSAGGAARSAALVPPAIIDADARVAAECAAAATLPRAAPLDVAVEDGSVAVPPVECDESECDWCVPLGRASGAELLAGLEAEPLLDDPGSPAPFVVGCAEAGAGPRDDCSSSGAFVGFAAGAEPSPDGALRVEVVVGCAGAGADPRPDDPLSSGAFVGSAAGPWPADDC
jgi:hypothetical protein